MIALALAAIVALLMTAACVAAGRADERVESMRWRGR